VVLLSETHKKNSLVPLPLNVNKEKKSSGKYIDIIERKSCSRQRESPYPFKKACQD
jgi:hypothetical protein